MPKSMRRRHPHRRRPGYLVEVAYTSRENAAFGKRSSYHETDSKKKAGQDAVKAVRKREGKRVRIKRVSFARVVPD